MREPRKLPQLLPERRGARPLNIEQLGFTIEQDVGFHPELNEQTQLELLTLPEGLIGQELETWLDDHRARLGLDHIYYLLNHRDQHLLGRESLRQKTIHFFGTHLNRGGLISIPAIIYPNRQPTIRFQLLNSRRTRDDVVFSLNQNDRS